MRQARILQRLACRPRHADRRQSRDVAKSRGIEAETGMISEHRNRPAVRIGVFFSFLESSFESKLKGVGPGVADASDRPRRPPPGRTTAAQIAKQQLLLRRNSVTDSVTSLAASQG